MRATILTEGGKHFGLGHIYRCEAIIQALKTLSIDCTFIINGDSSIPELNLKTEFILQNWQMDFENILDSKGDIVILDSYHTPLELIKTIVSEFKVAAYLDDFNRLEYPPGLVINSSITAHQLDYGKRNGTEYLLGTKYHPMRFEFWDCKNKVINRQVKEILITLGGADIQNLTPSILNLLKSRTGIRKNVVVGRGFSNIDEIEQAADHTCDIRWFPDAAEMKELMMEADIAVSAAGQTIYELARIGLPTIAIGVADNQNSNISGWQRAEFIEFAGWWYDPDLKTNIAEKLEHLMDYANRKKKSLTGSAQIDGSGALQIAQQIIRRMISVSGT